MLSAHTSTPVLPLLAAQARSEALTTVRELGLEEAVQVLTSSSRAGAAAVSAAPCAVSASECSSAPCLRLRPEKSSVKELAGCTASAVGPSANSDCRCCTAAAVCTLSGARALTSAKVSVWAV